MVNIFSAVFESVAPAAPRLQRAESIEFNVRSRRRLSDADSVSDGSDEDVIVQKPMRLAKAALFDSSDHINADIEASEYVQQGVKELMPAMQYQSQKKGGFISMSKVAACA